jgi:hypothetical protein
MHGSMNVKFGNTGRNFIGLANSLDLSVIR